VKDDGPIKTIADVKGKSVGINVFGSGIYGPMALLLKKHGVDPEKDIKLVETGFPASEDAIRSGRVDVGVLNQPFAARARRRAACASCSPLPTSCPTSCTSWTSLQDFVDKDPELARHYVRDLTAGMAMAMANRDETLKVVSEVTKAPIQVLDTYLLKPNDFAREPARSRTSTASRRCSTSTPRPACCRRSSTRRNSSILDRCSAAVGRAGRRRRRSGLR
jgi:ABC-type nitrate/sulfonate/bicarbonate transport system substrate-binding protein